jgi:hypothetical protein
VEVVDYVDEITPETRPIGIQYHNIEHMDEGFMYNPCMERGVRRVSKPGEAVAILINGDVDTNFVHPNANPYTGKKAYLGPSGLVTDDASFGGPQVGVFLSSLNDSNVAGLPRGSDYITVYGGGFVRGSYMMKVAPGKFEIQEPTIENVTLLSPGWVRLRVNL